MGVEEEEGTKRGRSYRRRVVSADVVVEKLREGPSTICIKERDYKQYILAVASGSDTPTTVYQSQTGQ
uniref:Uncharacterized protein n=1 Tax=Oryza punctata TaxID=4537 RepID=A0A0E0MB29_ORYPU